MATFCNLIHFEKSILIKKKISSQITSKKKQHFGSFDPKIFFKINITIFQIKFPFGLRKIIFIFYCAVTYLMLTNKFSKFSGKKYFNSILSKFYKQKTQFQIWCLRSLMFKTVYSVLRVGMLSCETDGLLYWTRFLLALSRALLNRVT